MRDLLPTSYGHPFYLFTLAAGAYIAYFAQDKLEAGYKNYAECMKEQKQDCDSFINTNRTVLYIEYALLAGAVLSLLHYHLSDLIKNLFGLGAAQPANGAFVMRGQARQEAPHIAARNEQ